MRPANFDAAQLSTPLDAEPAFPYVTHSQKSGHGVFDSRFLREPDKSVDSRIPTKVITIRQTGKEVSRHEIDPFTVQEVDGARARDVGMHRARSE